MIYLVDDNKDDKRRKTFNVSYVDDGSFADYLTVISTLPVQADLGFLSNADCVLVHESTEDIDNQGHFISGSNTNARRIIEDVSDYGTHILLVVFSNQITGPTIFDYDRRPHLVSQINKTLLYQQRLYPFLNYYRHTGQVELRIIAFGENFRLIEAGRYARQLIEALASRDRNQHMDLSFLPALSNLELFYEFMEPEGNFIEFINDLEDHPATVGKFIHNISSVLESISENYGHNTYTWKS